MYLITSCLLTSEIILATCKNLEKNYERASPAPQKTDKRAPKAGGFATNLACGFSGFGKWKSLVYIILPILQVVI